MGKSLLCTDSSHHNLISGGELSERLRACDYKESINQARMIIGYYNQLPSQKPTSNITQLDLLFVHWPINCGPCGE